MARQVDDQRHLIEDIVPEADPVPAVEPDPAPTVEADPVPQ